MGLEIFLQDARYGVMRNGKITCPAKFKRIEHLASECGYYALGVYLVRVKDERRKYIEITTIIDRRGYDIQIRLRGKVRWHDGYFCGIDECGNSTYINCWDPMGKSYYYGIYPDFHLAAGVEIGWASEHVSTDFHCKRLRFSTGKVSPRFDEWEMFYNRDIIIARDYLIVKNDKNHSYRISGYLNGSVLVECDEQYGYLQIMPDGSKGQYFKKLPKETRRIISPIRLGLQRVET